MSDTEKPEIEVEDAVPTRKDEDLPILHENGDGVCEFYSYSLVNQFYFPVRAITIPVLARITSQRLSRLFQQALSFPRKITRMLTISMMMM